MSTRFAVSCRHYYDQRDTTAWGWRLLQKCSKLQISQVRAPCRPRFPRRSCRTTAHARATQCAGMEAARPQRTRTCHHYACRCCCCCCQLGCRRSTARPRLEPCRCSTSLLQRLRICGHQRRMDPGCPPTATVTWPEAASCIPNAHHTLGHVKMMTANADAVIRLMVCLMDSGRKVKSGQKSALLLFLSWRNRSCCAISAC